MDYYFIILLWILGILFRLIHEKKSMYNRLQKILCDSYLVYNHYAYASDSVGTN